MRGRRVCHRRVTNRDTFTCRRKTGGFQRLRLLLNPRRLLKTWNLKREKVFWTSGALLKRAPRKSESQQAHNQTKHRMITPFVENTRHTTEPARRPKGINNPVFGTHGSFLFLLSRGKRWSVQGRGYSLPRYYSVAGAVPNPRNRCQSVTAAAIEGNRLRTLTPILPIVATTFDYGI